MLFIVLIIILISLCLLLALVSYIAVVIVFEKTVKRSKKFPPSRIIFGDAYIFYKDIIAKNNAEVMKLSVKRHAIKSIENLNLAGYQIINPKNNKDRPQILLFVHGWRSSGLNDLSFIGNFYYKFNFDVFTYDQVGCGESEGKYTGYGITNFLNIALWVKKINELYNHNCDIVIHGFSAGATAALLVSSQKLENVISIVADSGFTSAYDEMVFTAKRYHVPKYLLKIYAHMVKRKCKYSLDYINTKDVVVDSIYPILYIHGRKDTLVPFEMAEENYKLTTSDKQLLVTETITHATSYFADSIGYEQTVLTFIHKYQHH